MAHVDMDVPTIGQLRAAYRRVHDALHTAAELSVRFPRPFSEEVRRTQEAQKHHLFPQLGTIPPFTPANELELEEWVDGMAAKVRRKGLHQALFHEVWLTNASRHFATAVEKATDEDFEEMVSQVALKLFPRSDAIHQVEGWLMTPDRQNTVTEALNLVAHTAALYVRLSDRHGRTYAIGNDQMRECYLAALPEYVEQKLEENRQHLSVASIIANAPYYEVKKKARRGRYVAPALPAVGQEDEEGDNPRTRSQSPAKRARRQSEPEDKKQKEKEDREKMNQCKNCLDYHYQKNCPFRYARCRHCNTIGHISRACPHWVRKDARGRVDAKVEDRPGGYGIQFRTDRTQRDKLETTNNNVAAMLAKILKHAEEEAKKRKTKMTKAVMSGERRPPRPLPQRP